MMQVLWSAADPGGADAVEPVLRKLAERGDILHGIAGAPAAARMSAAGFSSDLLDTASTDELRKAVQVFSPELFLAGTSAAEGSVDKRLMSVVTTPSVYAMDFWSNYRVRFAKMPSAICVIDERMKKEMTAEGFDPAILHITGNPHFDHFADSVTHDHENEQQILFISQPVSQNATRYGFDEFDALKGIIAVLPAAATLSIRLHPKDEPHKYGSYLNDRVQLSTLKALEDALSGSRTIVGMFSPVLIQAAAAGKNTISFQPNLLISDPLASSELGFIIATHSIEELRRALAYEHINPPSLFTQCFPPGATERTLEVIDRYIS